MESIDAFAGRGGGLVSCVGGTYQINPIMYKHAKMMYTVKHPSALGITIAYELGQKYDKPSFCVNPPDVDEFITEARITGIPEIYRESRIHALNQKEIEIAGVSKAIFTLIKPQLDANFQKYLNGKKAKRKQNRSKR